MKIPKSVVNKVETDKTSVTTVTRIVNDENIDYIRKVVKEKTVNDNIFYDLA